MQHFINWSNANTCWWKLTVWDRSLQKTNDSSTTTQNPFLFNAQINSRFCSNFVLAFFCRTLVVGLKLSNKNYRQPSCQLVCRRFQFHFLPSLAIRWIDLIHFVSRVNSILLNWHTGKKNVYGQSDTIPCIRILLKILDLAGIELIN